MNHDSNIPFKAFNYDLEPAGLNLFKDLKLRKFIKPSEPNYIARTVLPSVVNTTTNSQETTQAIYECYLRIGQEKASHLQEIQHFGINLPPTYFTAGSNEHSYLTLYSLTQLVNGPNLLEYTHINETSEDMLEIKYTQLIESLCNYYSHCFHQHKSVLFDTFGLQQYVISSDNEEIYLVDTDSYIDDPSHTLANYLVTQLRKSNNILENKFQSGSNRLHPANEHISHLASSIITI